MSVLILAEHHQQQISPALAQAVTAAQHWNSPVHVLVVGTGLAAVAAQAAALSGVAKVLTAEADHLAHPLAEDVANLLLALAPQYQVILAAHSNFSKNILPRAAALLDVAMLSDVLEIQADDTYVRAIYAGSIQATVRNSAGVQVLSVHGSSFAKAATGNQAEIASVSAPAAYGKSRWIAEHHAKSDRPALSTAGIVVSGGRSLGSAEKFEAVLSPLASKLGAALGATRAAVDAGYAPNETQVGQTGIAVAPELYIAVGISGAVQHTFGMKDSRVVVAINQDPDAPIFQVADYGLVADLFEAVPQLAAAIK